MNNSNHNQDSEFAALAQGKLPATALGRVRRRLAGESRRIKQDIRKTLQRYGLDIPHTEPAPASLRKELRTIPGRENTRLTNTLRWGLAATLAASLIVVPVIYRHSTDNAPSPAEIAQARAELAIAFSYVQQVSIRTDSYMKSEIGHTMQDAIIDGIFLGVTSKSKKG